MKILYDKLGSSLTIPSTHNKTPLSVTPIYDIADMLSTSLGPAGNDKIIQTKDNEIIVTNDGATILANLDVQSVYVTIKNESPIVQASLNAVVKMIIELSQSQDENIGDGTTSVVIIAAYLLKHLNVLIERGENIMKIVRNLGRVLSEIEVFLDKNCENVDFEKYALLAAKTALYSKIVSFKSPTAYAEKQRYLSSFFSRKADVQILDEDKGDLAKLCVEAINYSKNGSVVNLNDIKIVTMIGASISKSIFIDGVLIKKGFAHSQMETKADGLIGLLATPLEMLKPKTKTEFVIKSAEEFTKYEKYEKEYFANIITTLKRKNIKILFCQFGFEDELTSMLTENNILAVRWVGGTEMENLAVLLNANISSKIEDIEGVMGSVKERTFGIENKKMIQVSSNVKSKICTLLVRGSTDISLKESERSIHDALCAIRNLLEDNQIVYGGGAIEMDLYNYLNKASHNYPDYTEIFVAFGRAIREIPRILLRNQGVDPKNISTLGKTKGVTGDMKDMGVFETIKSKKSQLRMAKEVCVRLLKVDEVIQTNN